MSLNAKFFTTSLLVLSSLFGLESTFAQVAIDTTPTQSGSRDTIVIIQRDTVVILQKETIRVVDESQEVDEDRQERSRGRGGSGRSSDSDVVERRKKLREERMREYEEWYAAQPIVRTGDTWGFKFYPSALGQMDFPSVKFGVERTFDGKFGVQGNLGILIPPSDTWSFGFTRDIGNARFGLRGLDIGVNGRYYTSNPKNRFPFYLELEANYGLSPIELGLWTSSADGTFEQFVQAPVNAQQFYFGFVAGWELRTKEGLLLDLASGLRLGTKSLKSSNPQVQDLIDARYWNLNEGGSVALVALVTRIGIGYGKWSAPEKKASSKKTTSRKKRGKKRRRR